MTYPNHSDPRSVSADAGPGTTLRILPSILTSATQPCRRLAATPDWAGTMQTPLIPQMTGMSLLFRICGCAAHRKERGEPLRLPHISKDSSRA